MRSWLALCVLAAAVAACADEPFRCPEPRVSLRNPNTLVCDQFHVPSEVCPDELDPPTWATCNACAQIAAQSDCLAAPGCRAVYDSCYLLGEPCLGGRVFATCVGVDRAGPVAGVCEELDAEGCSSRDDCAAWHRYNATCNETDPRDDPRPQTFKPQNGACVLLFASCGVEPTTPIVEPTAPAT